MGGLVAVVRLDGGSVDRSIVERWKGVTRGARSTRVRAVGSLAYCFTPPLYQTSDLQSSQPCHPVGGSTLLFEGRLNEPHLLARDLSPDRAIPDDAGLAALACDRWGPGAYERLDGEFSWAFWEPDSRKLTLARDALGARALHYHFDGSSVWFATSLHHLLAIPEVPRDLDELGLAGFMARGLDRPERTLYRHIKRVPSGGAVNFQEGHCQERRYWTLEGIAPVRFRRDEDYVERARELFDRAVANRLPAQGNVASMLSGGFDSAAVTATAARLLGDRRLTAITRVAGAPNPYRASFDEQALAAMVAGQYPNIDWIAADELHLHDRLAHPEWDSAAMGVPVQGAVATWFEPLDKHAAAAGARTLLSGSWGNATLSWTGAGLCLEQVRRGDLVGAALELHRRARRLKKPFGPMFRTEFLAALEPRALRRWRRNWRYHGRGPWQQMAVFAPGFLDSVDYAAHARDIVHDMRRKIPRSGRERRWTMMRQQYPVDRAAFLRNRVPHEVIDPFRDRQLVAFSLGVPEAQFQRAGVERWLARRAFADRLPAALLAQDRRGVQNGEWYHVASLYREQTAEAIERIGRSPLASRVLDVKFLKSLVDTWPEDAESAMRSEGDHRYILGFGVSVGSFLRWYEGSNG